MQMFYAINSWPDYKKTNSISPKAFREHTYCSDKKDGEQRHAGLLLEASLGFERYEKLIRGLEGRTATKN